MNLNDHDFPYFNEETLKILGIKQGEEIKEALGRFIICKKYLIEIKSHESLSEISSSNMEEIQ